MKKLITLIAILFITLNISAQKTDNDKITWYSFEEAVALQAENPKKIFVDVYTDWCGWCKKMDANTFTNPVIIQYMNDNYYAVKFNAEGNEEITFKGDKYVNPNPDKKRSTHQLAQALLSGRMSYPSYAFLDEKSELLTVVPGYMEPKAFEPIIHFFAKDAFLTKKWEEFSGSFESGIN